MVQSITRTPSSGFGMVVSSFGKEQSAFNYQLSAKRRKPHASYFLS
jgi:hypothetical protein